MPFDLMRKFGGKRAAAALAAEDGMDWNELSDAEKEKYMSKAFHKERDKKTTKPVNKR
jgi:hypothetical protein